MLATAAAGLELGSGDLLLAGSSLSHVGAFYVSFGALSVGAGVVVARTFDGDELLPLLRDDRPTVLSMLPSALFALTRDHGAVARRLRLAAALPRGGRQGLGRARARVHRAERLRDRRGLWPDGDRARQRQPSLPASSSARSGRSLRGSRSRFATTTGEELRAGERRSAVDQDRAATVGYWDDDGRRRRPPSATAGSTRATSCEPTTDGYLYFCGRRKQIIVHDGSNISPQEIEGVLLEHPSVESAGVIGIHDLVHGENVRAYITLRGGRRAADDQELIRFARAKVGYKAPEEIVVLDEMPLTATGKVDRTGLKRMAEANLAR